MNLMRNPNTTAYFCWLDDCESIEDAWECETMSAARAAEEYHEHIGIPAGAMIRVGNDKHSDVYWVSVDGVATLATVGDGA